nr:uncharacterized protein LOC109162466 [Ipomoea batatas]
MLEEFCSENKNENLVVNDPISGLAKAIQSKTTNEVGTASGTMVAEARGTESLMDIMDLLTLLGGTYIAQEVKVEKDGKKIIVKVACKKVGHQDLVVMRIVEALEEMDLSIVEAAEDDTSTKQAISVCCKMQNASVLQQDSSFKLSNSQMASSKASFAR